MIEFVVVILVCFVVLWLLSKLLCLLGGELLVLYVVCCVL